ncbi:helix-turn-helix domain-containing protein [Intestinibacter sp.]
MKDYNVQQISEMLRTNPETVRRWIRSGKLTAVQDSRKTGNLVTEEALKKFMKETPKYAGVVASVFAPTVGFPIVAGTIIGGLLSVNAGRKTKVSPEQIKGFLEKEIDKNQQSIQNKEDIIKHMKAEIEELDKQIVNYQYALSSLDFSQIADEINKK